MARKLDGQVALVCASAGWGSDETSRAVALALGARGVRVVVTGPDEKKLGETVGELVYQGAKARHLAGDIRDAAHLAQAVARAKDVFGALDIVVADARETFAALPPHDARLVALGDVPVAGNAVVAEEPEDSAAIVVFLCSEEGASIRNRTLSVRGQRP